LLTVTSGWHARCARDYSFPQMYWKILCSKWAEGLSLALALSFLFLLSTVWGFFCVSKGRKWNWRSGLRYSSFHSQPCENFQRKQCLLGEFPCQSMSGSEGREMAKRMDKLKREGGFGIWVQNSSLCCTSRLRRLWGVLALSLNI